MNRKIWKFFLPLLFLQVYLKISAALISNKEVHFWVPAISQWEAIKHLVPPTRQLIHLKDSANVINLEWKAQVSCKYQRIKLLSVSWLLLPSKFTLRDGREKPEEAASELKAEKFN